MIPSSLPPKRGDTAATQKPVDHDQVLILDFGSQTAQLIARRVREQNVFCRMVRHDLSAERIREINPRGLVLSGGPASVYAEGAPLPDPELFELGIPILGICYGMQVICRSLGANVNSAETREFGRSPCRIVDPGGLFSGLPDELVVWMSHGDQVEDPEGSFVSLAATDTCPLAAVRHSERPIYGLQFHPEVTHTDFGGQLLKNFVQDICGFCRHLGHQFADRSADRADPVTGRQQTGHLWAVGWSRLIGRCRAALPGHRGSTLVHLRRQRPAARGRIGRGPEAVHRSLPDRPARCRRSATIPR
ncbi:MAG: hypothetical protein Ct9H300mP1_06840 [Planctomycetaceae bacterium]|nr:MAG: hypothetical protein Ct9H300mP1_06840 [Planctomycetaceae bacterium]